MKPPFTITSTILNYLIEISKVLGNLEIETKKNLHFRKENRIKSIHSSLAIENNSLSIEQITAIIDGKRVLGDPKEIKEVKNAYEAYEKILNLDPYSEKDFLLAHKLLTTEIVGQSGKYRNSDVGIFDEQGNMVHLGARPQFIGDLMGELFEWGRRDDTPALVKSCVFHYEIEMIHPFEDGNGRMGRLWQNVILANWNPLFSWIPIETIIYENQQQYYKALAQADRNNNSTVFIEFMLGVILETLLAYKELDDKTKELSKAEQDVFEKIREYLKNEIYITVAIVCELIEKSKPTVRRYIAKFVEYELLESHGENRDRRYSIRK